MICKLGDFPKTRFLRDLLDKVLELYGAVCNLDDFLRRRSAVLALLERAYITSLYLPFRARREDYEVVHDALGEALDVLQCLEEFIELLRRRQAAKEEVIRNLDFYLCKMLQIARGWDPSAEVLEFDGIGLDNRGRDRRRLSIEAG